MKTIRVVVLYIAILIPLLILGTSSYLLEYSSTSLSFHMTIEHSIFLGLGALLVVIMSYCLQAFRKRFHHIQRVLPLLNFSHMSLQQRGKAIIIISCLAVSALLMGVWHLPWLFAAAIFHEELHLLQHGSFILTGSLSLIAVRMMPTTFVILSLVLVNATMGLFGASLLVSNHQIFIPYSVESHIEAGNVMIALCIVIALVAFPVFIINRSLKYELKNQQNMR